jgi:predicted DNA-binding protein YlxM (UPF0122 family)
MPDYPKRQGHIPPEELKLTAAQQELMEALMTDLTDVEIAVRLDSSRAALHDRFKGALKKLGARELERRFNSPRVREKIDYQIRKNSASVTMKPHAEIHSSQAVKEREARAEVMIPPQDKLLVGVEEIVDPGEALFKLMQIAQKTGVPKALLEGLSNRIMKGITEVDQLPPDYKDDELHAELRKKVTLVLAHIDEATVGGAKLTELSSMLKTLQEQTQLLEGRPTAILAVEDKQGMSQIAEMLQAEMARRGKIINGTCEPSSEDGNDTDI